MAKVKTGSYSKFWEKYLKDDFANAKVKEIRMQINIGDIWPTNGEATESILMTKDFLIENEDKIKRHCVSLLSESSTFKKGWINTGYTIKEFNLTGKDLIALLIAGINHDLKDDACIKFDDCVLGGLAHIYLRDNGINPRWAHKTKAIDNPIDYGPQTAESEECFRFLTSFNHTEKEIKTLKYLLNEILEKSYLVTFFETKNTENPSLFS